MAEKTIALPPVVDLDAIDTVRDGLIDAVERGPLLISAAAIERISTNALFMLLSAAETARRNSFSFAILEPSEALCAAVDRLGLGESFADILKRAQA